MDRIMNKIKMIIALQILILLLYGLAAAVEPDGTAANGDWEYLMLEDGSIEIVKYHGESKELIIPGSIDNRKVTRIGESAFEENLNILSVVIPDGVKIIDKEAFYACARIKEILIPNSVKIIGESAFSACISLEQIDIPETVTTIGNFAFFGCPIKEIQIPDSVISMGCNPFVHCQNLSSIIVSPDHPVYSVIDGALCDKDGKTLFTYPCGLTNVYAIPQGVETIRAFAFAYSTVEEVKIPDGVKNIEAAAFRSCAFLREINIPESVTVIGEYTFTECSGLITASFPNSLKEIRQGAFNNCSSLTSISLPKSLSFIGDEAFSDCASLKYIEIPGNVTEMGNDIFTGHNYAFYAIVGCFSYAKQYCKENNISYRYIGDQRSKETESIYLSGQDMINAFSEISSVTIPLGPEVTVHIKPNAFIVSTDAQIDRVICPIFSGDSPYYQDPGLYIATFCNDGFLCLYKDLPFFFVQIGDYVYHYKFSSITCKDSFSLTPDYVTVLYQNSGAYIASKYEITSSGWFYAYGKYHLNEIEAGVLVCVYDAGGLPQKAYLYECDKSESLFSTVSMIPFSRGKTIWETPKGGERDYRYTEVQIPQTIYEVEKCWNVSFPYVPDPNEKNPDQLPQTADEVLKGNYIKEEIGIEFPHLEGNMLVFDCGFDEIYGFNNTPEESYDGHHIPYGLEYYTVVRGPLSYKFTMYGNESFYQFTGLHDGMFWRKIDLIEVLPMGKNLVENTSEYELSCFDGLDYYYSNKIVNGVSLDRYSLYLDTLSLLFSYDQAEERIWATYDLQTGELLEVDYTVLAEERYIDEWTDIRQLGYALQF